MHRVKPTCLVREVRLNGRGLRFFKCGAPENIGDILGTPRIVPRMRTPISERGQSRVVRQDRHRSNIQTDAWYVRALDGSGDVFRPLRQRVYMRTRVRYTCTLVCARKHLLRDI